jgi:hypothetical protein
MPQTNVENNLIGNTLSLFYNVVPSSQSRPGLLRAGSL